MAKKYEFTGEEKDGLKRIRAIRDFSWVKAGTVGGWIESEKNLSHDGDALVFNNARVDGNARVGGKARVADDARVGGYAQVAGKNSMKGSTVATKPFTSVVRSDGFEFSLLRDADGKKVINAGCRYFELDEAIEHWKETRGGTPLGEETLGILKFLETYSK